MELRQLRYFLAVAEEQSFSRAARRLHVSQPPLSVQVKALERELGVTLLERSNRGVTLTAAGQAFRDEVVGIFGRLEQARLRARAAGQGEVGTLSVGFVSIADYGILPPALKRFRELYPRVDVQLHELTTDAQIDQIRAARLDLGIALGPVDQPDLTFETVLRERLLLAVPTSRRLARTEGAVPLKALAAESFIIPPREVAPGLFDLIVGECRASGFAPRITQYARQMQTVVGLVASGMGVALVPSSVRNLRRAGVRYRPLRASTASVELGLLRPRDGEGLLAGRFAAVLKEVASA